MEAVVGGCRLTDGLARVELGLAVSWNMSFIFGSQSFQLVFDDVLTLSHAEEVISSP